MARESIMIELPFPATVRKFPLARRRPLSYSYIGCVRLGIIVDA